MGIIGLLLIIWLVMEFTGHRPWESRYPSQTSSVEILKERYARGEISRDAYLEALKLIH